MASYRVRVRVPEDRRITLQLPDEIPPGEAEVTVAAEETARERETRGWPAGELLAWLAERRDEPKTWTPRTKDEIDADIAAMRDEWDRDR
jgi:hypothetical protein